MKHQNRIWRFLRGRMSSQNRPVFASIPDGFDWRFYVSEYVDLQHIQTEGDAIAHFLEIGAGEGRIGTPSAVADRISALEQRYGSLPATFDWSGYIADNPDLSGVMSRLQAAEHFLRFGRSEGRSPVAFDADLYRQLYFPETDMSKEALLGHFLSIGLGQDHIGSYRRLAARHGLNDYAWIRHIKVPEFSLLNETWAGAVDSIDQAVGLMVREGFARVAPLAFHLDFDPGYYAEANPALALLPPGERYKDWLFRRPDAERPGSAPDHLARHGLTLGQFPDGFDWTAYQRRPGVYGDTRWALLDHVVANESLPADEIPVLPNGGHAFLSALGVTISGRNIGRGLAILAEADRYEGFDAAATGTRADRLLQQGRPDQALALYEKLTAERHAPYARRLKRVEATLDNGDVERAITLLAAFDPSERAGPEWRSQLRRAIDRRFYSDWEPAQALYLRGETRAADLLLTSAVEKAAESLTLDPVGVRVPREGSLRYVVLANVDLRQCTHYRVEQKEELFASLGYAVDVYSQAQVEDFMTALPGAAAAIFYRLPAVPSNVRAIGYCRALGIPSYYEIDDLVFDSRFYPDSFESYQGTVTPGEYAGLQLGVPLFRAAMGLCDYGIASTAALAEHMREIVRSGEVFVIPNGTDSRNEGDLDHLPPRARPSPELVVFYGSGTRAQSADFLAVAGDALADLLGSRPDIRLIVAGTVPLDARFEGSRDRITSVSWTPNIAAYWSVLAEADVNLAVMRPTPAVDCKSEIKWLEAAAAGVPTIASNTATFSSVIDDGVDGLLASTPDEWRSALTTLIGSKERRLSMVAAARAKVRATYTVAVNSLRLKDALSASLDQRGRTGPDPGRKRILIVNTFFPPQTIGGATRVVRDNIDYFLTSGFADEVDLAILTSDEGNPTPYQMRVDDYRGLPVFRVSTPLERNMDWRPENEQMRPLLDRVLSIWRPDLVHLHATQRITGTIADLCGSRQIPYIVTMHDAWWVSDFPFLVDESGRVRDLGEAFPSGLPSQISMGDSLRRRRRLAALLRQSCAVLGVSDTFTALLNRLGHLDVRSVPNGVPHLNAVTKVPSPNGKVRLAHIGGQTHHKGYYLVMAALKQSRFSNLELTVVDHSRFGGNAACHVWGGTTVRVVGKTRQEDMHRFYREQDVLLAPSLWPESFGLVTREAVVAGLWVLASDRGAIGEAVDHGRNGWIVDVSHLAPTIAALAEMNRDPQRFLQPAPPPSVPLRHGDDQAAELQDLYLEMATRRSGRGGAVDGPSGGLPRQDLDGRARRDRDR